MTDQGQIDRTAKTDAPQNTPQASRHHRARGEGGVLDRGLANILASVAIVAALGSYYLFGNDTKAQATLDQVLAMATQVHALYSTEPSYKDLTTASIANMGTFPASWLADAGTPTAGIVSPYRSPITVEATLNVSNGVHDGNFAMTLTVIAHPG